MFPSARYGSTGHTVLLVLPRIVTPVAVQVAVSRGLSDRIAVRTISFLHASPERDMLPAPAASVQHLFFFHCVFTSFPSGFSILSLWSSKRWGRKSFHAVQRNWCNLVYSTCKTAGEWQPAGLFCMSHNLRLAYWPRLPKYLFGCWLLTLLEGRDCTADVR